MPVKIRLMRIGARARPFYRVVAVDERRKRTGGYLELLGTYNPLTQPKEINLLQDKIDAWMKKGAQPSDGFLRIIGKAKQRLPRKAKKEKKGGAAAPAAAATEAPAKDETPVTEEATAEAPVEAAQEENAPEATAEEAAPAEVAHEEAQAEPAAEETPATDAPAEEAK